MYVLIEISVLKHNKPYDQKKTKKMSSIETTSRESE